MLYEPKGVLLTIFKGEVMERNELIERREVAAAITRQSGLEVDPNALQLVNSVYQLYYFRMAKSVLYLAIRIDDDEQWVIERLEL